MKNSRWQKEQTAIKAVQVAFDISAEAQKVIKQEALTNNLNPPDQIRKPLGLSYNNKPVRPRLTVTLNDEECEELAARQGGRGAQAGADRGLGGPDLLPGARDAALAHQGVEGAQQIEVKGREIHSADGPHSIVRFHPRTIGA